MRQSIRSSDSPVQIRQLGLLDYADAWQLQRETADARLSGGPDTLLLLEHPAVYTAGKRTEAHERPVDGTPVIDSVRPLADAAAAHEREEAGLHFGKLVLECA